MADFPDSGHFVPEFPDMPYREVIVNPYRFFYRVAGEGVWIVSVGHARQMPEPPAARLEGVSSGALEGRINQ